jgi:hypothetical protein
MLGRQTLAMREVFAFTRTQEQAAMVRAKLDDFLDSPRTTLRRYTAEHRSAPFAPARAPRTSRMRWSGRTCRMKIAAPRSGRGAAARTDAGTIPGAVPIPIA